VVTAALRTNIANKDRTSSKQQILCRPRYKPRSGRLIHCTCSTLSKNRMWVSGSPWARAPSRNRVMYRSDGFPSTHYPEPCTSRPVSRRLIPRAMLDRWREPDPLVYLLQLLFLGDFFARATQNRSISTTMPSKRPCGASSMNSGSPLDLRQIFLSGFAPKRLTPVRSRGRGSDHPIRVRVVRESFAVLRSASSENDSTATVSAEETG
jgi:hypothetical protein